MTLEYRVRWRREGRQRASKIFQTGEAAHRKARGINALEEVKARTDRADMPDLVEPPVIEVRECSPWAEAPVQPGPPTDSDREGMLLYFGVPDGGPAF